MTLTFPDPCLYKSAFSCGNYEKDPGVWKAGKKDPFRTVCPGERKGKEKRRRWESGLIRRIIMEEGRA